MKLQAAQGSDSWLRQCEIRDEKGQLAVYQNCLTHCCGLSGFSNIFAYRSDLTPKEVDEFVQWLQWHVDNDKTIGSQLGTIFTSPCILFTTSVETDDNAAVQILKKHPKVSKKFDFLNHNEHTVEVWAITLDVTPPEEDDED